MKTFRGIAAIPADWPASAVSIGKFDGVHVGHRAVLTELKTVARAHGLVAVVVTFDRHPLALLSPATCPAALLSSGQKLELLAETGVDATVVLEFNEALASLPPEEFIEKVLVKALRVRQVLVGGDFRFGAKGAGDVALLQRLGRRFGFDVRLVDDVKPDEVTRVSSSVVRGLLLAGETQAAAEMLGHVHSVRGVVVHGAARGRELGFPTANLSPDSEGLVPADGVYAGWLTDDGTRYPAAISVGNNPTFDGVAQKQVEAYVLDRDIDLYGHVVEVAFEERIRGMVAFTGIEPLVAQMREDVDRVRALLV